MNHKPVVAALVALAVLAACETSPSKEDVGMATGAIIGGVLGHQIGRGSGQTVATIGGAALGGFLGSRIGRKMDPAEGEIVSGKMLMENVLALLPTAPDFTVTVSPALTDVQLFRMPLQQILLNLIGNAIKHHDRKAGTIEVTLEDHGAQYLFAVRDDGPGIPKQFQGEVFKMFHTLKPRDQVEGSGMGLAMVRKHIELAGGTLSLESGEGRGCVFRFTWPKTPKSLKAAA